VYRLTGGVERVTRAAEVLNDSNLVGRKVSPSDAIPDCPRVAALGDEGSGRSAIA
jgi:hypothetical protein